MARTLTLTEQALRLAERQVQVAKKDNTDAHARGVTFKPSGYVFIGADRVSFDAAVQFITVRLEEEQKPAPAKPKAAKAAAGPMTWDKLNQATKDFFFDLCEQIQTVTRDHSMVEGVRLGHDLPKISLPPAPRLSNLK